MTGELLRDWRVTNGPGVYKKSAAAADFIMMQVIGS
jgi:hypothetical protein